MKTVLMILVAATWELPQTILALFVWGFHEWSSRTQIRKWSWTVYCISSTFSGMCLGRFIFINTAGVKENTKDHEYGHSLQSLMLGPLYLLVVGVPSFFLSYITQVFRADVLDYYNRFPEKWADKLGGIERNETKSK
jgi:hypothetical protein